MAFARESAEWPVVKVSERDEKLKEPFDFAAARKAAAKRSRNLLAAQKAIDAVEAATKLPFTEGLAMEQKLFMECLFSTQSKAMIHCFFGEREVAKIPGLPKDTPTIPINKAAIIGAGTMGGGIAMNFMNAGIPVIMKETTQDALDRGVATIKKNYANSVKKGRFTQEFMDQRLALLTPTLTYDGFEQADIIIEAVFEGMALKKEIFAAIDAIAKPGAILASNTSTLSIDEIASATKRPESVIGTHFFSPANVMKLLEVVRGAKTSNEVINTCMQLGKKIAKVTVLVGNCFGFVGNRMFGPYRREAQFLAEEGASVQAVDAVLYDYGMAMGPMAVGDARQLAAAAPYWRRMPTVHPGLRDGYLQAATIFWDYFQFDEALAQIAAARKQFHDPALYGYEAGAIYENENDAGKAVVEYVAAAIAGSAPAHDRLITLATRPGSSQLVDVATQRAATGGPTLTALGLRADVLGKQEKSGAVAALVESAVDRASSLEEAEQLVGFAQQRNLTASYQHALRREVALAADPVQRIELQYALVQSLVAEQNVAAAQPIIESVYKENSRVIGVVRATADFYWEHQQPQKAIGTLTAASEVAYPELARSYTLEAAEKSNANGDYAAARRLVTPVLDADPYGANSARCLAIVADSYARAGNDAGLRDFYMAKLDALKAAPGTSLAASDRRDATAVLRRGLIPALTRMKDYAGAVDQQMALIGAFPEDAGVVQEAALYALRYGRQQQLLTFLNKAVADSPRDSRFAIASGSVETVFEDYPAAIDAYGKAIAIRKDRSDLYIARADLEERLQRFDDVCADYQKLYFLSYKDPQWMVKTAEARARQGKDEEAVQALQTAWIEGRPAEARNAFRVAGQLEKWSLLNEARPFAEQGVALAGADLLAAPENHEGAAIYARILTRLRDVPDALKVLEAARRPGDASASSPAAIAHQAEKQGLAAVSDAEWRRNLVAERQREAAVGFTDAVQQMAVAAGAYFTPEEKVAFAKLLDSKSAEGTQSELASTWIPVAATAGLKDREAEWRKQILLSPGKFDEGEMNAFNLLEKQRMENEERGRTLETYGKAYSEPQTDIALAAAADAWRDEANLARELAVLGKMDLQTHPAAELRQRYFQLLLRSAPNRLVEQASRTPADYADEAANYVFAHGARPLAYAAIDARAANLQPVWHTANTALAGLYFADKAQGVDTAFRSALDDRSIGERVAAPTDPGRHLAGNGWFYYGMRYGVYRTVAASGDAEDYLAAGLESDFAAEANYVALAEAYRDAKDTSFALREYDHALELAPNTAAIYREIALLLWSSGRREEALEHWGDALSILRNLVETRVVPESFWSDFAAIAGDAKADGLTARLRPRR